MTTPLTRGLKPESLKWELDVLGEGACVNIGDENRSSLFLHINLRDVAVENICACAYQSTTYEDLDILSDMPFLSEEAIEKLHNAFRAKQGEQS